MKLVVAAVIAREDGMLLIARRPDDKHLGGLWEFPGGKLEDGESPEEALTREIREELGITIGVERPEDIIYYRYRHFPVLMLVYRCRVLKGDPAALEVAEWRWVHPSDLADYEFPHADKSLVAHLARGTSAIPPR